MPQTTRPTAIDLFSGCGGTTLGVKDAGFRVVGAVEIDPLAVESFKMNRRGIKVWDRDIRDVTTREMLADTGLKPGELDLLVACPPCQGMSAIRTRNGGQAVEDDRNELIFEVQRVVFGLRPKVLMLENVPQLAKDWRFEAFVDGLERAGYTVRHRILDAADFGVPQRRKRLVLLAGRDGEVSFGAEAPDRVSVRDAISHLSPPGGTGDPLHDLPETRSARVAEMIARIPADGGSRRDLPKRMWLECHRRTDGFKDVYGRMRWDDAAPTVTGGCVNPSKGRFLHPQQNRAVTLREAALLQSFPPEYKISTSRGKYAAAALIGNAFPPKFAARHARSIRIYLNRLKSDTHDC